MQHYRARLRAVTDQRGPLCVGVDPHAGLLERWGLDHSIASVEKLSRDLVAAVADQVAVFKPQAAFFESWGSSGMAVLERVLADIRASGAIAILDAKRGDIGSTMAAYAASALADDAPLQCDALTVSPYLGVGALQPAIDTAVATGRGLYVLCRTSNPDGTAPQLATTEDGVSVAQDIVRRAHAINEQTGAQAIGLVIGATRRLDVDLSGFGGSILVPGVGAQGGRIDELPSIFGPALAHALPSSSRDIIAAGPDPAALRAKVAAVLAECEALSPPSLQEHP